MPLRGNKMNRPTAFTVAALLGLGAILASGNALAQREGRTEQAAPVVAPGTGSVSFADLPVWKRVTLGSYKGINALRKALDAARVRVGDSADEILGRPAFHFSPIRTDVDLVVLRVSELGFQDATSLGDIYRRAGELGLELCPAEVAPLLRLQYVNQPMGEFLNVAMRPIAAYGGELIALSVANAGTGPLLLGGEGRSDLVMNWRAQFVFVRPARIASPNVR
jgi:hypothetical protein